VAEDVIKPRRNIYEQALIGSFCEMHLWDNSNRPKLVGGQRKIVSFRRPLKRFASRDRR
jgi:hypothetical protein